MAASLRILLVDSDAVRRELVKIVLDAAIDGAWADVVGDPVTLGQVLGDPAPAAVVVGHPSDWLTEFEVVERLRDAFPAVPLVVLGPDPTERVVSASMRLGVSDYVGWDAGAPLRVRDALLRLLASRSLIDRRRSDRRGGGPRPVPLSGVDPEPRPPTTPGRPAPAPKKVSDPSDAPTATMPVLKPKRRGPADLATELGRPGLKALLEEAGVAWFRCEPAGDVMDSNRSFRALFGATSASVDRLGRLGLSSDRWTALVSSIKETGRVTESRMPLKTLGGDVRYVTLTLRGASAGKTQPVIDGLLIDATETEHLWERLGDLRVEQHVGDDPDVIDIEDRRRQRADRGDADPAGDTDSEVGVTSDRDVLLGLSHDLQEPLRTVRIYADLLEEKHGETLSDDARTMVQRSRAAAARMEEMVADLVDDATVQVRPEPRTADLQEILTAVQENLAAAISDSEAAVSHGNLPVVAVPPSQMLQVLQNLVSNAIKYRADAPPRIHVSAERGSGEFVITVQDNGMGIPDEFQSSVFEMFERGAQAESLPGSGIGLAVCRRVVESHGGRIWVDSTEGEGSTFHFTVPLREPAEQLG